MHITTAVRHICIDFPLECDKICDEGVYRCEWREFSLLALLVNTYVTSSRLPVVEYATELRAARRNPACRSFHLFVRRRNCREISPFGDMSRWLVSYFHRVAAESILFLRALASNSRTMPVRLVPWGSQHERMSCVQRYHILLTVSYRIAALRCLASWFGS